MLEKADAMRQRVRKYFFMRVRDAIHEAAVEGYYNTTVGLMYRSDSKYDFMPNYEKYDQASIELVVHDLKCHGYEAEISHIEMENVTSSDLIISWSDNDNS